MFAFTCSCIACDGTDGPQRAGLSESLPENAETPVARCCRRMDIARRNRDKLGIAGMDESVAFDETRSLDDFPPPRETHGGMSGGGHTPGSRPQKTKLFQC